MKIRKKHEKGITLVALVITIVVLIILATVSINMILDDDGILGAAELAKDKYQNAAQKEKEDMYELEEYLGESLESVGIVPTVEELQSRYEFKYYSSMSLAVKAVNEGKINEYADKNKDDEDAVAGIYTKEGNDYVVLLKNNKEAERITANVDMTINLGGHELSSDNVLCIDIVSGKVTIDGRLKGSTINISHTEGKTARTIQVKENAEAIINGGKYITSSEGYTGTGSVISIKGETTISNAVIEGRETTGILYAVSYTKGFKAIIKDCDIKVSSSNMCIGIDIVEKENNATIINCNIEARSTSDKAYGIYNSANNTTVTNCNSNAISEGGIASGVFNDTDAKGNFYDCNIKGYANYESSDGSYTKASQGVFNCGEITLNNCNVMGVHSGIDSVGTLYINGGTYEGYGHGGFYFAGTGTISYVRNATIRECAMPEGYTAGSGMDNNAGFYIGGAAGNDNIKVYMDNCDIYGSVQPIVLRGSASEKNNSLYISNSKINTDKKIRIDNDTHKLYIGVGNNFTADNTNRPSVVETTNETYIKSE